jgi:hypothetical protein
MTFVVCKEYKKKEDDFPLFLYSINSFPDRTDRQNGYNDRKGDMSQCITW